MHCGRIRSRSWVLKTERIGCVGRAFDFNFHTHVQLAQDGRMVIMCYDEGYVLEGDGVIPWVERGDMNRSLAPRLLS